MVENFRGYLDLWDPRVGQGRACMAAFLPSLRPENLIDSDVPTCPAEVAHTASWSRGPRYEPRPV